MEETEALAREYARAAHAGGALFVHASSGQAACELLRFENDSRMSVTPSLLVRDDASVRVADLPGSPRSHAVICVNDVPGTWGCPALRLGAQVSFELLCEGVVAVAWAPAKTRGRARRCEPWLRELLVDKGERLSPEEAASVGRRLSVAPRETLAANDAAAVLAQYLRCHPKVEQVSYPGLEEHPDHALAEGTLEHGFGPLVGVRTAMDVDWASLGALVCRAIDARRAVLRTDAVSAASDLVERLERVLA